MTDDMPGSGISRHDAFISYSRKDKAFAAALERALQRYRPPRSLPVPQRRLQVFRDEEDFTGTEYRSAVREHLRRSNRLIVICSPHASQSSFVDDEIRQFSQVHAASDIIPVIIKGLANNEAKPGQEAEMAFPAALCEALSVPLACDFRGYRARWDRPDSARFRGAWYKLLAELYGVSREEIEERERKRRTRQRMSWSAATLAVVGALSATAYVAETQRRRAEVQARSDKSRELAGKALALADSDPELGTQLSLAAVDLAKTNISSSALRVNIARLPDRQITLAPGADLGSPTPVAFSPDGTNLALADKVVGARLVDLGTHDVADLGLQTEPIAEVQFSPYGRWLVLTGEGGSTTLVDARTRRPVGAAPGFLRWGRGEENSGRKAVLLGDRSVQRITVDDQGILSRGQETVVNGYSGPKLEPYDSSSREVSADGGRIATLLPRDPPRIQVTDLSTGKVIGRTVTKPLGISAIAWSSKSRYLLAQSLFGFVVLDGVSLTPVYLVDTGDEISGEDFAFSNDESRLAVTDRNGTTSIYDLSAKRKVLELIGEPTRAYRPRFAPGGHLLSVIYANGRARMFDLATTSGAPLAVFDAVYGDVIQANFSPDSRSILLEYANGKLSLFGVQRWTPEYRIRFGFASDDIAGRSPLPDRLRITPDRTKFGYSDGQTWHWWDVSTGREIDAGTDAAESAAGVMITRAGPNSLEVAGRQVHLAASGGRPDRLRLSHDDEVRAATLSPDGSCALTASGYRMASGEPPPNGNLARLWDTETGVVLGEWRFGMGGPDAALFAGQEHLLVFYGGDAYAFRNALCQPVERLVTLAREKLSRDMSPAGRTDPDEPAARPAGHFSEQPAVDLHIPASVKAEGASAVDADLTDTHQNMTLGNPARQPTAPSFDCARARDAVERLICTDTELMAFDVELARVYRSVVDLTPADVKPRLIQEQRAWIRGRAACRDRGNVRTCIVSAYRDRLAVLSQALQR